MAKDILRNVRIFSGGADLTGQSNKIALEVEYEEKDVTNFGSVDASLNVWKELLAGNASAKISATGQWEASDTSKVDDDAYAALGGTGAFSICPVSANAGEIAYVANMLRSHYQLGGAEGDVNMFELSGSTTGVVARGVSLHPPGTARTSTGSGTAVQSGAVVAGKRLYANLHVLSASGTTPSLTVKVQSDDNSGFSSATDRITFTAATDRSSQVGSVAGAITDDYWRVNYTISGTSPSFLFVVTIGIGTA